MLRLIIVFVFYFLSSVLSTCLNRGLLTTIIENINNILTLNLNEFIENSNDAIFEKMSMKDR